MPDICERPDGVKMTLPDIHISNSTSCHHVVSIDNTPMEVIFAVRYLLADRERILTLLADAKAAKDV